jgi:hypothetical protein
LQTPRTRSSPPSLTTRGRRDLGPNEAYDLVARTEHRRLAIDDMGQPRVGDWFALDARGAPRPAGLDPGRATLHAFTRAGHRGGSGYGGEPCVPTSDGYGP